MTLNEEILAIIEEKHKCNDLIEGAAVTNEKLFLSVTGGGGKTTFLYMMSHFFKEKGLSVLLTTTTKFQSPAVYDWGADLCTDSLEDVKGAAAYRMESQKPVIVLFAKPWEDGCKKYCAPTEEEIAQAAADFDVTICEADGSKGLPIKIHTDQDPVIHPFTDFTIAILGANALLKAPKEAVFGENIKPQATTVDYCYIEEYIKHPQGLLKGAAPGRCLILVNRLDEASPEVVDECKKIRWPQGIPVVAGSLKENMVYEQHPADKKGK